MQFLNRLVAYNKEWAKQQKQDDAAYFSRMALSQEPECLWVGCADSRVPPALISGLGLGKMFTHRNVANVISPTDNNFFSVLQYAVDVLNVDYIIVCGHYRCGGVLAALTELPPPPLGTWLKEVQKVKLRFQDELDDLGNEKLKWRRLCELNVQVQIETLAASDIVQGAWNRGGKMVLHGLMFDIETGILSDANASRFGNTS